MRTDRIHAISLRQDGKSYSEISNQLGVAKSTLSKWFASIPWSSDVKNRNNRLNQTVEKLARMHEKRHEMLKRRYISIDSEAVRDFYKNMNDTQFVSGLTIYRCIGDCHPSSGLVRLSSSDYFPIKQFQAFLKKYCGEHELRSKIRILVGLNHNVNECEEWWLKQSRMPKERLLRTTVSSSALKNKKLQYGVATLIMSNKFLKMKILKWLDILMKHEDSHEAGIV